MCVRACSLWRCRFVRSSSKQPTWRRKCKLAASFAIRATFMNGICIYEISISILSPPPDISCLLLYTHSLTATALLLHPFNHRSFQPSLYACNNSPNVYSLDASSSSTLVCVSIIQVSCSLTILEVCFQHLPSYSPEEYKTARSPLRTAFTKPHFRNNFNGTLRWRNLPVMHLSMSVFSLHVFTSI